MKSSTLKIYLCLFLFCAVVAFASAAGFFNSVSTISFAGLMAALLTFGLMVLRGFIEGFFQKQILPQLTANHVFSVLGLVLLYSTFTAQISSIVAYVLMAISAFIAALLTFAYRQLEILFQKPENEVTAIVKI